ncbi:MAG: pectinesterase family protein [Bacillota bacterium]
MIIEVSADGNGDFTKVQDAIDHVPDNNASPVTIRIKPGVYKEKLHVAKPFITLLGEGKNAQEVVLTFDDCANKTMPDGEPYGTFRSYSIFIGADHFSAELITFENSAGPGRLVGQALAAYVDGDRAIFRRCRFLGYQDTLFTGPLPPEPMKPGSFTGPRGGQSPRNTRQYYEDCYIEGDVDFIFGSATSLFLRCELFSKNRLSAEQGGINGWYTAASTPENIPYGYVFLDCKLTSDAPPRTVLLGRPWRNYAKTAFICCWMGEHIHQDGWDNWNKPEAEATASYCEYGSTGPGAGTGGRVSWSKRLGDREVAMYAPAIVLAGDDGWNPFE